MSQQEPDPRIAEIRERQQWAAEWHDRIRNIQDGDNITYLLDQLTALTKERDTLQAEVSRLREALVDLLSESHDPNAITGEFDTAAGRAKRLLAALQPSGEAQ